LKSAGVINRRHERASLQQRRYARSEHCICRAASWAEYSEVAKQLQRNPSVLGADQGQWWRQEHSAWRQLAGEQRAVF